MTSTVRTSGLCPPEDVEAVVRAWTEGGGGGVVSVRRLSGRSHRVYEFCDLGQDAYIARLAAPGRCRFDIEAAVISRCAAEGVPVPAVLSVGPAASPAGDVVMIQKKAEGLPLREAAESVDDRRAAELVRRAGEVLAGIHQVATTGFGPLSDESRGPADSLGVWFVDGLADKLGKARQISPEAARLFDDAFTVLAGHRALLDACPSGLLHGDFSPDNVLVDGDRVTAVLDWEAVKSGPPALDIGWWDCFFESPRMPTSDLIQGYGRVHRLDLTTLTALRHLCVLRVMIGHLSWTQSVGDRRGIALAVRRISAELESVGSWSVAD
ncbi:phosphotransferase [Catenulispora sp. NL8]|uniref:Phosphotransferase n=1 Tax=Catenulispora pinistramenti TaxID=2705254 RepID=A0ABS5L2G0_9ACTN|nr:phosphotransferase [Catenulispora pinistramenti]MBS2552422.1 phosphotransferase [Catenulispora pinistramenti]